LSFIGGTFGPVTELCKRAFSISNTGILATVSKADIVQATLDTEQSSIGGLLMQLSAIGSVLLLTVLPLVEGRAQLEGRSPRFGLTGGMNIATLSGTDGEAKNHTGLVVGGLVVIPVARNLAFQPEVLFATKGADFGDATVSGGMKLQYVEIPVVLRLDIPASGGVRPFAYAGPAFSLKTGCAFEGRAQGVSASISCDDVFGQAGEPNAITFRAGDVGGLVGGGLAFDVGGRVLTIGARYELGFISIMSDRTATPSANISSKNRVLSILSTFEWPFHSK
jgi:Outer membrane protein beta-barrel domain